MFSSLSRKKAAMKKLIAALREKYAYASVLAVADETRSWSVSRSGTGIASGGRIGGTG